jgi:hypothetical protein
MDSTPKVESQGEYAILALKTRMPGTADYYLSSGGSGKLSRRRRDPATFPPIHLPIPSTEGRSPDHEKGGLAVSSRVRFIAFRVLLVLDLAAFPRIQPPFFIEEGEDDALDAGIDAAG